MKHTSQLAVIMLCALVGGVVFWVTSGGTNVAGGIAIGAGLGVAFNSGCGRSRDDQHPQRYGPQQYGPHRPHR